jgi:hypothetical protein
VAQEKEEAIFNIHEQTKYMSMHSASHLLSPPLSEHLIVMIKKGIQNITIAVSNTPFVLVLNITAF